MQDNKTKEEFQKEVDLTEEEIEVIPGVLKEHRGV